MLAKGRPMSSATELSPNATAILNKRYLVEGESIDQLWDRVSGGNESYRRLLSSLRFLPNSPTLFNAGLNNGCTLSACFTFEVQDSMFGKGSITDVRDKAIAVAKAGGGVGYYFGHLRPKGSPIKSIQRVACGPVTVLRDYHGISRLITQGGKRELAQMGVLNCDHPDIREFIHCKDGDPQGLGSFNISVGWKSGWVDEALDRKSRHNGTAASLWDEQCESAWGHGCPGMFFTDTVNRCNINPHLGGLLTANPCGEVPGRDGEACSLGSHALPRYFDAGNRGVNWSLLEEDVYASLQFADDILDRNVFPHPDITAAVNLTRRLGIGVMGWADLLAMMHIHYDSQEALDLGSRLAKFIADVSHKSSEDLVKLRGKRPYAGYSDRTNGPCRRNETTTSIAPTGTISIIAGMRGWSIEPWYAETNERTTSEGMKLVESVPGWIREHLDGFVPKCAHEIHWEWHVRHQAAWQQHVDLGVSKTINMPNSASVSDVSGAYRLMYELGCKGGTVFRDGCRQEQVLVSKTKSVYSVQPANACTDRKMPQSRAGTTYEAMVGGSHVYLTANRFPDGKCGEIWLNVGQGGSTLDGMVDGWAIMVSKALQFGMPLEKVVKLFAGRRSEPSGPTGDPDVPVCTSIQDYVVRKLASVFLGGDDSPSGSGLYCPECGSEAVFRAGCLSCPTSGCGWSRCG